MLLLPCTKVLRTGCGKLCELILCKYNQKSWIAGEHAFTHLSIKATFKRYILHSLLDYAIKAVSLNSKIKLTPFFIASNLLNVLALL